MLTLMIKTLEKVVSEFPEELQEVAAKIMKEFTEGKNVEEIEQMIKQKIREIADEEVNTIAGK